MTFDEQLHQAFAALTDRLRDQIARELGGVTDELAAAAAADRDRAAAEAASDAQAEAQRLATARVEQVERAANAHIGESDRVAASRLAEVEATAERRFAEAQRVSAERLAEVERAAAARLDAAVADARAASRPVDPAAARRLLDAVRALDRARSLTEVLETLLGAAGRETARVAVLLVRGATLRAWRLVGFGFDADASRELLLAIDAAGVIADAVRTGATATSDTAGTLTSAQFALPNGRERIAVPIPVSGQVVAVLYADQGAADDPQRDETLAWPAAVEILVAHAARALEAITAFKTARAFAAPAGPQPRPSPESSSRRDEDDESARRYARLLISEIKMYHEADVAAGRRDGDLGARLGGEINRARALYEQRVSGSRLSTDHFHAELVRTLADGDEKLLGA